MKKIIDKNENKIIIKNESVSGKRIESNEKQEKKIIEFILETPSLLEELVGPEKDQLL